MTVRIQVSIRFLYEDTLYANTFGFIPRHEAIKIPELKVQENQVKAATTQKLQISPKEITSKSNKSKKQSDLEQQIIDENQDIQNDLEDAENDMENEGQAEADVEEMEQQEEPELENENEENQYEEDEQEEDQIDGQDDDNELSEISRSLSGNATYSKYKTKRQKGQIDNFLQLPLKKPRKDAKKFDQATQLIRKQEKQRKRRQYIKKLVQAQQKATFDKILNETGRKFRQREEKQMKEENQKDRKSYRTLGDIPKIITKQTANGKQIFLHNTQLFPGHMHYEPNIRMSENCSVCNRAMGKYKTKEGKRFCSITCFKEIECKSKIQKACA